MRAYERFLQYAKIDTMSDPAAVGVQPSTKRQFDLAKLLVEEMLTLGIADARVDDKCYVYGSIPASHGLEAAPPIGFIAHMDTSPDCSGSDVQPLLHPNYSGCDVCLPSGDVLTVQRFPNLAKLKGETLITASGGTLLGADNKAGIAEILTACEELLSNPLPHGKICVAFTPDEEIGEGATGFDVAAFGARYAYTVDGEDVGDIEYENFNAAWAKLWFGGVAVHPGAAKDIMCNASTLAMQLHSLLPADEVPEKTEGREGFFHLTDMRGNVEQAYLEYIIRDHDRALFEQRKQIMRDAVSSLQKENIAASIRLEMGDSYYNMSDVIREHYHLIENAASAISAAGLVPSTKPFRGGTDGSRLSFMGLPCPNLGTGGFYFHGPAECITAERMDKAVQIILGIVSQYAKP